MSWLHSFWGVGAAIGPYIMGLYLTSGFKWNSGYRTIGIMQIVLVACLALSLPLWKAKTESSGLETHNHKGLSIKETVSITGTKAVMAAFFGYCAMEATAGLWASSYMVLYKGINAETAAKWAALFYLGITLGRFISGFITDKLGDKYMVRMGQCIAISGAILLLIPGGETLALIGLILTGLGCAPVFPSLIHATPSNFGADKSQSIIGMQMASAYAGTTFMPPVFGLIAKYISIRLYPIYLLFFAALMIVMVERLNKSVNSNLKRQ
jgi:fucose permease